MAALAPLNAVSAHGTVAASPPPSPLPGTDGAPPPAVGAAFTAFPASYSNFGNDVSGYGQVGIKNGAIAVVPAPSDPAPAAGSSAPAGSASPAGSSDPSGAPAGGSTAAPGSDPPADPKSGGSPAPPGDPPPGTPPLPPIPIATLPPQPIPQTPGLDAPSLPGPFPAQQAAPFPGPFAAQEQQQTQGPSQIQQQQQAQEEAAQQAQAQQADQEAEQHQALTGALQNVSFRLSAAYGEGNAAAAAQLAPIAVQINGELQNQPFAGVGTTPPKPFAPPEIPNVFLNIPS